MCFLPLLLSLFLFVFFFINLILLLSYFNWGGMNWCEVGIDQRFLSTQIFWRAILLPLFIQWLYICHSRRLFVCVTRFFFFFCTPPFLQIHAFASVFWRTFFSEQTHWSVKALCWVWWIVRDTCYGFVWFGSVDGCNMLCLAIVGLSDWLVITSSFRSL